MLLFNKRPFVEQGCNRPPAPRFRARQRSGTHLTIYDEETSTGRRLLNSIAAAPPCPGRRVFATIYPDAWDYHDAMVGLVERWRPDRAIDAGSTTF